MKKKGLVLTILSCVGVVSTAVLAVKATPKAMLLLEEKPDDISMVEKTLTVAPVYIPAMVSGVATVGCILGINVLSKRQQAALASMYALVSNRYRRYQDKVREIYGEEAHQNIVDRVAKEECADISPNWFDGGKHLFYDDYSGRYFEKTVLEVLQAEYSLNRNYCRDGGVSVNEFYELLGLPPINDGDDIGWTFSDYEAYWVDFDHQIVTLDDGLQCCIIYTALTPIKMEESYEV